MASGDEHGAAHAREGKASPGGTVIVHARRETPDRSYSENGAVIAPRTLGKPWGCGIRSPFLPG